MVDSAENVPVTLEKLMDNISAAYLRAPQIAFGACEKIGKISDKSKILKKIIEQWNASK